MVGSSCDVGRDHGCADDPVCDLVQVHKHGQRV